MSTAWLNGRFLPLADAHVSVLDRGFLFGDGIYEVIPVYGGRLFRLSQHLKRLRNSLDGVRITNPMSDSEWEAMLNELVARNEGSDQAVYLQVTRGAAPKRDHAFPTGVQPTVFGMSNALTVNRDAAAVQGVRAITLDDIRWSLCNLKAITLLPNVMLRQQAIEADTAEAILINNGKAIEGAASNLFIVKNGLLITPPNSNCLLPGVTRDLVIELAANNGIPHREADIPADDLLQADEIWLTSSTREISPVIQLDNTAVGDGKPGPLWNKMIVLYRDYTDAVRRGEAE
ncbi:MAG TPA: D-amino acid aminotransferase [Gammaproteobacteria bacterium]|nr:D-amino acid aminotransferase [Gammaproteobacteria bacterium]